MKKILITATFFACMLAAVTFGGCSSGEANVEYTLSEDGSYYIVDGVSGSRSALKEYEIPSTYSSGEGEEPKPVREIAARAFQECTSLKKITLPDSITKIGGMAFAACPFEQFIIPEGVTSIGNSAFFWCKQLKEIIIPSSVTQIGNSAFKNCSSLKRAVINAEVSVLYGYTLYNSWQEVGGNVFLSSSLNEIYLPATLEKINSSAFEGNGYVTDIYFAGTREQWDKVYFFELALKEGTENETEERTLSKSDIIPSAVRIHYEYTYGA